MTTVTLEDLADTDTDEVFDRKPPLVIDDFKLTEHPTPGVTKNLAKLQKLGILSADAILAIVGQAPIDPINLMTTLMSMHPEGWAFSAIDFSMVRVLARTPKKAVSAALRVDLMGGAISSLVLNKANQLTIHKTLDVEPRDGMLEQIQALCDDAVQAAQREHR
jgi:hypothetical protein